MSWSWEAWRAEVLADSQRVIPFAPSALLLPCPCKNPPLATQAALGCCVSWQPVHHRLHHLLKFAYSIRSCLLPSGGSDRVGENGSRDCCLCEEGRLRGLLCDWSWDLPSLQLRPCRCPSLSGGGWTEEGRTNHVHRSSFCIFLQSWGFLLLLPLK